MKRRRAVYGGAFAALFALSARGQDATPAGASSTAGTCDAALIRLEGAEARVKGGVDVAYAPAWTAELEHLARCASRPELERACLMVGGFSDEVAFAEEVVRAFGSTRDAQRARARSRASSVIAKLFELGVPPRMLREAPPTTDAAFRGVEVRVVADCEQSGVSLPEWVEDPERLAALLKARGFVVAPTTAQSAERASSSSAPRGVSPAEPRAAAPAEPDYYTLWGGVRFGEGIPWGALYDGGSSGRRVRFHDAASTGLATQFDLGLGISRRVAIFAFWERLWLGQPGSLDFQSYAGGQSTQHADSIGLSLRVSVDPKLLPNRLAFAFELGLAYRILTIAWRDGSSLQLGSPAVLYAAAGPEFPLSSSFSLSALLEASAGVFTRRELSAAPGSASDFAADEALHGTLAFKLAGHFGLGFGSSSQPRRVARQ